MVKNTYTTKLAGHDLIVESGEVAKQANGSVLVRFGKTTVLSAVVSKAGTNDSAFFPLTINYEEKNMRQVKFQVVSLSVRGNQVTVPR